MQTEKIIHVAIGRLRANPWGIEVGPPLATEDYETLRLSIKRDRINIPLIVWKRGKHLIVLSGGNRLKITRQLKHKTVPVIIRTYASDFDAKMFALSDNLCRRQLNTGQRAYLAFQYQQLISIGSGRRTDLQPLSKLTEVTARRQAAEKAGVSDGSVSSMKSIIESGDKSLLKDVLSGTIMLHAAARYVKGEASDPRLPEYRSNGHSRTLQRGEHVS
jgi:hypothetical protein